MIQLQTERLHLRTWREKDLIEFAHLCADPQVMRYFPHTLSFDESRQMMKRMDQLIQKQGWGFWALSLKSTGTFIGFTGLHRQESTSKIPYAPLTEVGWRLFPQYWGFGYATEAAQRALDFDFNTLSLSKIYAFTAKINHPSIRVMKRLGMHDLYSDFNHPKIAMQHPLSLHCLYGIESTEWNRVAQNHRR